MIGDPGTLLPDDPAPDSDEPYSILSCWPAPGPDFFEPMIAVMTAKRFERTAKVLRAQFLCPEGTEPRRTGTPLALNAPYPDGHPLANREN